MINFVVIAICLALGAGASRSGKLPPKASVWLNQYVIYICLPAVVITQIPKLSLRIELLQFVAVPWLLLLVAITAALVLQRVWRLSRTETGALIMLVGFGNTSFFGIPMITALLGAEAVPYAVIYDQLGSFLSLAIVGNLVLAYYAPEVSQTSIMSVARKVLLFPPFVALIVAFAFGNRWLPELLLKGAEYIALTLTPATMFLLGMHLKFRLESGHLRLLVSALSLKLVLLPMLVMLWPGRQDLPTLAAAVVVLEAAMPPMVTAAVLAIHAGLAPRLVSAVVGYGLLISCLSLPILSGVVS